MNKKSSRLRRAKQTRKHIREIGGMRLSVHRTPRHIYAQVMSVDGSRVLAAASTVEKELRESLAHGGNITAAAVVGKLVAERRSRRAWKPSLSTVPASNIMVASRRSLTPPANMA